MWGTREADHRAARGAAPPGPPAQPAPTVRSGARSADRPEVSRPSLLYRRSVPRCCLSAEPPKTQTNRGRTPGTASVRHAPDVVRGDGDAAGRVAPCASQGGTGAATARPVPQVQGRRRRASQGDNHQDRVQGACSTRSTSPRQPLDAPPTAQWQHPRKGLDARSPTILPRPVAAATTGSWRGAK